MYRPAHNPVGRNRHPRSSRLRARSESQSCTQEISLIYSLYSDTIHLSFNPARHTYHRIEGEQEIHVRGVSSILNALNEGEALTQWKIKQCAFFWVNHLLSLGDTRVEPDSLEVVAKQSKSAHKQSSQDAIAVGKEVHLRLQSYLQSVQAGAQECGKPPPDLPEHPEVLTCLNQAIAWFSSHTIEPLHVEQLLYSKRFGYAGTCDLIANVDGVLTLLDWKTSGSIYPKYRFQAAAYVQAFEEEHNARIEQRILSRLDKQGNPEPPLVLPRRGEQAKDFAAFRACLTLTERLAELPS
jgi:hypothetical protein